MFRNVMVPVDGTPFSREAVLQGVRIASFYGATLRLVTVATAAQFSAGDDAVEFESATARESQSETLANLYAMAAECRAHSTINVTASMERGPIVEALSSYVHRNKVDLIVMRSHARHGIARAWFGSVADSLIRESGVPVLVVRPPSIGAALDTGFSYRRIMVPLDGSLLAEQALPKAITLARSERASIMLVMVLSSVTVPADGVLLSRLGPAPEVQVLGAEKYLDSVATAYGRDVEIQTRVVISDNVPQAILDLAESEETDLIAMATRGQGMVARSLGGSVSDKVMRESSKSTLVLHPILRNALERPAAYGAQLAAG